MSPQQYADVMLSLWRERRELKQLILHPEVVKAGGCVMWWINNDIEFVTIKMAQDLIDEWEVDQEHILRGGISRRQR